MRRGGHESIYRSERRRPARAPDSPDLFQRPENIIVQTSGDRMKTFCGKKSVTIVIWLFFLSGASSLMYEIIWMRMLTIYVGGSAFSVSIVLTVFMAGLALGSAIAGRIADRVRMSGRLLRIYGWLKLAVGLYGLLFPFLMIWCRPFYALLYHRLIDNFLIYNAASALISTLLLIIPTTMIGAALPLLCRFVINDLPHTGRLMGRIYGADTLGAAFGTLLCGFWLIGRLGMNGSLAVAVTVNIVIGLFCLLCFAPAMQNNPESINPPPSETAGKNRLTTANAVPPAIRERIPSQSFSLYFLLAVSAFCAMSYEVIWTKLLALLVGPTTYSFTIVLFTFITGLALGGLLFGRLADRSRNPFGLLVITQFAAAVSVLAVSQFLGNSQILFAKVLYEMRDSFFLLETVKAILLFAAMVIPTIFLGAAIPVVVRIRTKHLSTIGGMVGRLYAVSTVGALLGSFSAGFVFIPLWGKAPSLSILAALQAATAIVAWFRTAHRRSFSDITALVGAAGVVVICLHLPDWDRLALSRGKYLRPDLYGKALKNMSLADSLFRGQKRLAHLDTDDDIIRIEDGIGGLVAVGRTVNSLGTEIMFLSVNGKIVTSTLWDLNMMVIAGHLPMLLHRNPERALVVGLGSGITAGEMLHYPLKQLDVVEISPEVVKACDQFASFHNNLLNDPRVHIIVQDARTHVTLSEQTYDVIVSDPINPWMAGSASLFTLDNFRRVKSRLNPGGIFVQWFHAYQSGWDVFSMFGRTFRRAFPNSLLVNTSILGQDYLFVGFADDKELMPDPSVMNENVRYAAKSGNMRMSDPSVIYPLIVTDIPTSLFGNGSIHTDEHPYMAYLAPRYAYTGGSDFRDKVLEKRRRSPLLQTLLAQFTDVDKQLALADFMASLNVAPFGLVRLEDADPSQMAKYRHILESFCRVNIIEDYSRLSPVDRNICLPVQERTIRAHIDRLTATGAGNWSLAAAYFDLAGIYAAGKDYRRAVAGYRQGLHYLPDHQTALSNLAACYEHLQAHDQAVDTLRRLITLRPRSAELMTRLALNLLKQDNREDALNWIEKALNLDRRYVPALVAAGMIHGTGGDYEHAIAYSKKALEIDPGAINAYQNLAAALFRIGEFQQALHYVEQGLKIDPGNPALLAIRKALVGDEQPTGF